MTKRNGGPATSPDRTHGRSDRRPNLEADPHELRNVFHDPSYAEVRTELIEAMWREQSRHMATHRTRRSPSLLVARTCPLR